MQPKLFVRVAVSALVLGALSTSAADAATTLRVQTSTRCGGLSFQYLSDNWVPKPGEITGDAVQIEFLLIDSVVPRSETAEGMAVALLIWLLIT